MEDICFSLQNYFLNFLFDIRQIEPKRKRRYGGEKGNRLGSQGCIWNTITIFILYQVSIFFSQNLINFCFTLSIRVMLWTQCCYWNRKTGPEDVMFRVLYSGVDHTDLHQIRSELNPPTYPLVPGYVRVCIYIYIYLYSFLHFLCIYVLDYVPSWKFDLIVLHSPYWDSYSDSVLDRCIWLW